MDAIPLHYDDRTRITLLPRSRQELAEWQKLFTNGGAVFAEVRFENDEVVIELRHDWPD